MADYRSFWFELAAKAMPQAFFVAKGGCGGEAIVLAPNEHAAREAAVRIWGPDKDGYFEPASWFKVERIPVVLCPFNSAPHPSFGVGGFDAVVGDGMFGDVEEIRRRLSQAREEKTNRLIDEATRFDDPPAYVAPDTDPA